MTTLTQNIKARLPSLQQIWPVFSIILFVIFSWMLYRFSYELPGWLYYMRVTNILILLAYMLSFSLVESLLILGFILLLSMIFPARYFKSVFVAQGSIQVFIITALAYALRRRVEYFAAMEGWIFAGLCLGLIVILVLNMIILSKIFSRFPVVEKWVSSLADRFTIFLYLYTPLGVLSALVIVVRNIF
ncbi:MAG: hypothetical protein AB1894_19640 [Chloroflexota bacterium]